MCIQLTAEPDATAWRSTYRMEAKEGAIYIEQVVRDLVARPCGARRCFLVLFDRSKRRPGDPIVQGEQNDFHVQHALVLI